MVFINFLLDETYEVDFLISIFNMVVYDFLTYAKRIPSYRKYPLKFSYEVI